MREKKISKSICFLGAFLLMSFFTNTVYSQTFTGPTEPCTNINNDYSYSDDVVYSTVTWTVTGGGTIVSGTGLSRVIKWSANGTVTVTLKNSSGLVVSQGTKNVSTQKPGTINAASSVCSGSPVTITSTGYVGTSFTWQYSFDNATWTTLSTGGPSITHTPTQLTYYRTTTCSGKFAYNISNVISVSLSTPTVAGTLAGSPTNFCSSGTASLSLTGYTGSVTNWFVRYQDGTGAFTAWASFSTANAGTNTYNVTSTASLIRKYEFYAVVKSGACTALNTNTVSVTVQNPPIGGNLSVNVTERCGSGTVTLTPSGYTGTAQLQSRSKLGANGNWASWTNTTSTPALAPGSSDYKVYEFRAEVQTASPCTAAYSTVVSTTVYPLSSAGTLSISQTTACTSATVTLSLSGQIGTPTTWYVRSQDNGSAWSGYTTYGTASATSNTYAVTTNGSVSRTYEFYTTVKSGTCSPANSVVKSITVYPATIAGTLSVSNAHVCNSVTTTLSLAGQRGTINAYKQRSKIGPAGSWSFWSTVTSTPAVAPNGSDYVTYEFQAFVQSGVCSELSTNIVTTIAYPATTGGTLTSNLSLLCNSGTIALSLSGQVGTVTSWYSRYKEGDGEFSAWSLYASDNVTSRNVNVNTNGTLSRTYEYYNTLQSGVCSSANSSVVSVSVYPSTFGGSILPAISDQYTTTNNGTLTLSNHIGGILRWEKNTGGSWTSILNTGNVETYTNLNQSTTYRAVVKNGICNEATSATAVVNIFPSPTVTYSQEYIPYGGNSVLTCSPAFASYQWNRNGQAISGATSQTYTATEPGSYTITVTGGGAVSSTQSMESIIKSSMSVEGYNFISATSILTEGVSTATSMYSLPPAQLRQTMDFQDGMGRTFQVLAIGQSPTGTDVVIPVSYSERGMVETSYLPYVASAKDGLLKKNAIRGTDLSYASSEQFSFYQTADGITHDAYPYSVKTLSTDPLLSIKEQGAPGFDWQPGNGHTAKNDIILNTSGQVRYWKPDGTTNSTYAANTLIVQQITDENGNSVRVFNDKLGRTLLKQVQIDEVLEGVNTSWLETYFIYDDYGRMTYQLPPKAMAVLGPGTSLDANTISAGELIFKYTYDARGRLIEKKVPAAGVQYFIYDNLDRITLTQDANLRLQSQWNFVKYDQKQRVVYTGLYSNAGTRASVQLAFEAQNYDSEPWYEKEEVNANYHGYSNQVYPTTGLTLLTVNYYDHYDFDRNAVPDYLYDNTHFTGQEPSASTYTRGLPTGSKAVIMNSTGISSNWLVTATFFDRFDRPLQTQSNNPLYLTPGDKVTVIYDFVKALKSKTTHRSSSTSSIEFVDRVDYDAAGRVISLYRKIGSAPEQAISQYTYNALGQVANKKIHGKTDNSWLQQVDYTFTIRGWLKKINDPNIAQPDRFFAEELMYNEDLGGLGHTKAWNGNITATKWKENFGNNAADDVKAYAFQYFKNDHIKKSQYGAGALFTSDADRFNEFDLSYDANGNLKTLKRNGVNAAGVTTAIDNLQYSYLSTSQNQLTQVEDASANTDGFSNASNSASEFTFDNNGNVGKDLNKGISSMVYNELNLVKQVTFSDGRILKYSYDAGGRKLSTEEWQGTTLNKTTLNAGGFVYENNVLAFFSSPEGRVVVNGSDYEYQYSLTDHQGNTRTVFTAKEETLNFKATFETNASGLRGDTDLFESTGGANEVSFIAANTTPGGDRVVRLNNSYHAGPGMMLRVYPGDKIDANVNAYFENNSGFNTGSTLNTMITAIAGVFGGVSGGTGEIGTIYDNFSEALNVVGLGGNQGDGRPSAYLNYIFFDETDGFDLVNQDDNAGWTLVPAAALMTKTFMSLNVPVIKKPGYLYIYLSYENESPNWVNFDDLQITYKKSQVIQNNNYYAFGLQTSDSWTRVDTKPNQYLYNQASELNSNTGLYETPLRGYDPALGRFQGVDIMADMYSGFTPYQYADNQPVNKNDPTGAYADDNWWNVPHPSFRGFSDPQQWKREQRLQAMSSSFAGASDNPTQTSFFAKAGTLGFNYDSFMFGGTWETQETHSTITTEIRNSKFAYGKDEEVELDITVTKRVFVADPPDQQGGLDDGPGIPLGMWTDPSSLKLKKIGDAWYGSSRIDEEIVVLKLPNGIARVHLTATVNYNFSARLHYGKKDLAQYLVAAAIDRARVAVSEELYANPAISSMTAAKDFKEYFGVYLNYLTFGSEVKSYAFPGVPTHEVKFQLFPSLNPGD